MAHGSTRILVLDIAKFERTIVDSIDLDQLVCQSIDNPVLHEKFFLYSKLRFISEHVSKLIDESCIISNQCNGADEYPNFLGLSLALVRWFEPSDFDIV